MSVQNRINANLWTIASVNGNNIPTGLKNVLSGSSNPTAANSLYPALYINTTDNSVWYNSTGAANAWVKTSGGGGGSQAFVAFGTTGGF